MNCKTCHKEIESEEIERAIGMKVIYCCSEVQVNIDSLRFKVRQSVKSYDKFYNKLYFEIMKDSD